MLHSSPATWKDRPTTGCCARIAAWCAPVNIRQVAVIALVNIISFAIVLSFFSTAPLQLQSQTQPHVVLAPSSQQLATVGEPAAVTPTPPAAVSVASSAPALRNCIMGMASNVQFDLLYHFVRSARTHCATCTILLFMPESDFAPPNVRSLLTFFDVEVFHTDNLFASYTAKQRDFHPSSTRWMLMHDHLASWPESRQYNALMVTDVRDTVFQRDPFVAMRIGASGAVEGEEVRRGVWVAMETARVSIAQEGWNRGWIQDCYGAEMVARVGSNVVSCSGTTLATWREAKLYIQLMADHIRAHEHCERNGIDQGVHNVLVHTQALQLAQPGLRVYQESTERGQIATLQGMPTMRRNEFGFVLNEQGEPMAVVHQVDRSSVLMQQFQQQFPIVPEHERNRK